MLLRLGLPLRNVSASGLGVLCFSGPVADTTGKDVSASGLKRLQPGGRNKICRGREAPDAVRMLRISARRAAYAFEVGTAVSECVGLRPWGSL